jgi:XTP/dITP diphosphohydrolase
MISLVLATRNAHKIEELRAMLADLPVEVLSFDDFPDLPDVVEDGATLEENAAKKALEVASFTGLPSLADDTGLSVDALGGAPGIRSARYSGDDADAERNNAKLLRELAGVAHAGRSAAFRCAVALATPGGETRVVVGETTGVILEVPRGEGGFGYDPLFLPEGHERTYAEMGPEEKNAVSHRGKAIRLARGLVRDLARGA